MSNGQVRDPDDFFQDTRMSFGDHIEELRSHLFRALKWFLLALLISFFFGHIVLDWITAPVKDQLDRFYDRRQKKLLTEQKSEILAKANKQTPFRKVWFYGPQLKALLQGKNPDTPRPMVVSKEEQEVEDTPPGFFDRWFWGKQPLSKDPAYLDYQGETVKIPADEKEKHLVGMWMSLENPLWHAGDTMGAVRELLEIDKPTTLNVQEAFFVWFKVCLVTGFILGSPWIFMEIWMFVAAGLYPHEKRLVHVYLPVSLGLFLFGVVICYFFVIPRAIEALLFFNEWLGFKPDLRLNEWLSFAILMPLIFGISFQTPLVMMFIAKLGIMNVEMFRNQRRLAWFAMAIFAAICTPSTDAFSMLFLWVPMSLLFELGIILIQLSPPPPPSVDEDAPEADELVEV